MRLHRVLAACAAAVLLLGSGPGASIAADELVADDSTSGVQITGAWTTTTTSGGFYGSGYRFLVAGDGASRVRWPFPSSGTDTNYEVFARWTSGPNRASNATYAVTHAAGTTSVAVDQRVNGAVWRSLGTFRFAPGAEQGVSLSDRADGVVVADAIRWVPGGAAATTATADGRFFEETRFRIDRDSFWDFFQRRGGVRTFGFPVSREFIFTGCSTQLFQRLAMQQCGGDGVGTLNLLGDGLLPFTRFSGSTVPAPDPALIASAPVPGDANYGSRAVEFIRANTPDSFEGEPVRFLQTYLSTVSASDAFPNGGDAGLVPLLNLQLWGLPTSQPAVDPMNHEFIYQRFQRGVMHYDRGCKCTQGLLLADYLKAIVTGERLPADLAAQAAGSPLLRSAGRFGEAFVQQTAPAAVVAAPPPPVAQPAAAPAPTPPAARWSDRHRSRTASGPG
jgi:hypothetical protein